MHQKGGKKGRVNRIRERDLGKRLMYREKEGEVEKRAGWKK
jgi:hypothetical protein